MKRSWKNFKLDKNKIYAFIGKAVIYIGFNAMLTVMGIAGFMSMTIYR